jgi:hypothetical protein
MFVAPAHQILLQLTWRPSLQLDTGQFDLFAEIAQRLEKFLFARHLLGHIELPANLAGGVDQCHVEPAPGSSPSRTPGPAGPAPTTAMRSFLCHRGLMTPAKSHDRPAG